MQRPLLASTTEYGQFCDDEVACPTSRVLPDPVTEQLPLLAGLASASIQELLATGTAPHTFCSIPWSSSKPSARSFRRLASIRSDTPSLLGGPRFQMMGPVVYSQFAGLNN